MKKMKKVLALLLAFVMTFGSFASVIAADDNAVDPAESLNDIELSKMTITVGSEEVNTGVNYEGGITLAYDGKEDTWWHSAWSPSWFGTDDCEEHLWVQFDFTEATVVNGVRYLPRQSSSRNGDITGYRVEGTEDGTIWSTLTEGTWESNADWKIASFDAQELTAVRLVATSTYADSADDKFASASEIRVTAPATHEVVPVENYTMSVGTQQSGNEAEKATDGDTGTWWHTSWNPVGTSEDRWIQIELPEATEIDALRYYPRYQGTNYSQGEANGYVGEYRVEVSLNGQEWETAATGVWASSSDDFSDSWKTAQFEQPVRAKYVKLVGTTTYSNGSVSSTDMAVAEINLIAPISTTIEPADYTAVDEAIAAAEALVRDNYVDLTAVDAAVAAVVRDKDITAQAEVDAMAQAINDAIAALELKAADYTAVDEAIAAAEAIVRDNYVDLTAVDAAVAAVVRDKDITAQAEVDAMAQAINDAIAALELKAADYTAVDEAIAAAEAIVRDNYVDLTAVDAAVAAVVRDKDITAQAEVDAMAQAINDAIAALELKKVGTFEDVYGSDFYYDAVEWAHTEDIVNGKSETIFAPSEYGTRGDVVTFLWRAAGCPEPTSTESPFEDVVGYEYYYKAVLWAVETGIANGTSETRFSPNVECTRAQVVTFLWRAAGSAAVDAEEPFEDVEEYAYYYDAVRWAVSEGITEGKKPTVFDPDGACTRGEIVEFLYRQQN